MISQFILATVLTISSPVELTETVTSINDIAIEKTGTRKGIRINDKFTIEKTGTRKGIRL